LRRWHPVGENEWVAIAVEDFEIEPSSMNHMANARGEVIFSSQSNVIVFFPLGYVNS
jgi:hypothetical protein